MARLEMDENSKLYVITRMWPDGVITDDWHQLRDLIIAFSAVFTFEWQPSDIMPTPVRLLRRDAADALRLFSENRQQRLFADCMILHLHRECATSLPNLPRRAVNGDMPVIWPRADG